MAIKFQPLAIKHKSNGLVWVGAQEGNALPNPPKITSGRLSPMYLNVRLSARLPQTLSIKLELLQTNLILFQKKKKNKSTHLSGKEGESEKGWSKEVIRRERGSQRGNFHR